MNLHDLDCEIARHEGYLDGLRHARDLLSRSQPAPIDPDAPILHPVDLSIDNRTLGRPVKPEVATEATRQRRSRQTKLAHDTNGREERIKSHSTAAVVQERREKIARLLRHEGALRQSVIAHKMDISIAVAGYAMSHPWFVRDDEGFYRLTPQANNEMSEE